MHTLDWQEQERRAAEIREILGRTLQLTQSAGLLEWVDSGWLYQGDEQTLVYNPDSDQLSVFSNDRAWKLDWHENLFLREAVLKDPDRPIHQTRKDRIKALLLREFRFINNPIRHL